MRRRLFNSLLTITVVLVATNLEAAKLSVEAAPTGFGLDLLTTVGSQLDTLENKATLTLEPTLTYDFGKDKRLELYTAVDRPFNQFNPVTVPKVMATYAKGYDVFKDVSTTATVALSALSVDRWSTDGRMMRASIALTNTKEFFKGFYVGLKVGPYGQLNQYLQTTSGRELSKYGLTEKVTVEYQVGPVIFDVVVLLDQKYTAVWKNGYSMLEQVAFRVDDKFFVGVSHELLGNTVDDSTGLSRPMELFNERNSRVSAFVEYQL